MKFFLPVFIFAIFGSSSLLLCDEDEESELLQHESRRFEKKIPVKDFELRHKGRVKQDFFFYQRPFLFGSDSNDSLHYFRNLIELGMHAKQGMKTFGDVLSEAAINFKAYNYWQQNNVYDRYEPITVSSAALDGVATADSHTHTTLVPHIFLEEGWVKINFGTFCKKLEENPVSLTIGYFAYQVGRGIALGKKEDLSVTTIGWGGDFGATRFPMQPSGILIRGQIAENFSVDLYFNKWRSNNDLSTKTYGPVYQNRLNWPSIYRGKDKDRDTVAVRADLKVQAGEGDVAFQPYFTYTRAPELPIEFVADSKARLGTVGMMTDWNHPRIDFNVEFAGQFGSHKVLAFDRNVISLQRDATTGYVQEVYSHIRSGAADAGAPVPVTTAVRDAIRRPENLTSDRNGREVMVGVNPLLVNGRHVFNSSRWGQPRIRDEFKINYSGLMGMMDVAYKFEDLPIKAAIGVGYIGGDSYPFNTENGDSPATALQRNQGIDKSFKGFVPQRESYRGKEIHSLIVFDRQSLLRPTDLVNTTLVSSFNFRDLSNLTLLGTNVVWYPLSEKNKLSIEPNVIAFWEASPPKKWDKSAVHPNAAIRESLERSGIKGWLSKDKASPFLGTELNIFIEYEVMSGCKLSFRGWLFKPGQLYRDIEGTPNSISRRRNKDGTTFFYQFGSQATYGFYTGAEYKF